ncbi:MAG: sulfatase [Planctomycetota bacterium]|nr:sulfatase [Planctomycetota bacterium]
MRTPSFLAQLACGLLLTTGLLGCGKESGPPLATGVQHLDLRLEDGSSPVEALAGARLKLAEFDFSGGLPEGWELTGGKVVEGEASRGGIWIAPLEGSPERPALVFRGAIAATEVNAFDVELAAYSVARSDLVWNGSSPLGGGFRSSITEASAELQTVSFSLLGAETWAGEVNGLLLRPSANRLQGFELTKISFYHEPFAAGDSPSAEGLEPGSTAPADGGLILVGRRSYRAWPADLDQVLQDTVVVPVGGRLELKVARSPGTPNDPIDVTVEARRSDGSVTEVASLTVPDERKQAKSWHTLAADLSAFAGEELTLRFRATSARPSPSPRARVLYGAPLVTGKLIEDRRPNIVLVTLDTLRFDALGSYQSIAAGRPETSPRPELVRTPNLDAFAAAGFVFEDAWSAVNSTQPSHASILTGTSVQDHSLFDNYGSLAPGNTTLAERLRGAGYRTAAVVCQGAISPGAGFGQGFDQFIPSEATSGLDGSIAVEGALEWLAEWEDEGPFFLWVHLFDPHTPYELPDGFVDEFVADTGIGVPDPLTAEPPLPPVNKLPAELAFLEGIKSEEYADYHYHVEVAYTDRLMGQLLAGLDSRLGDTLAIVTADHGEFLGERGNYYNHRGLFPETLHVPLILRLPGQTDGGRVGQRVTNRDIVPTVLSQLGLVEVPAHRDLVAVAAGSASAQDRVLWFEHANRLQVGCRDEQYHFIATLRDGFQFGTQTVAGPDGPTVSTTVINAGDLFLYDWTVDPGLVDNLAEREPELVAKYQALLEQYRAGARPVGRAARAISDSEAAELEALGYTGD